MEDRELEALLSDIESDRSERTESANDPDKIGEAICAFANDLPGNHLPGVLFLGVRDDGSCAGLPITDQLLQTLADFRNGRVQPIPSLVVQKKSIRGCDVAVVIVQPSDAPPVRYKGVVRIRVGPRRDRATPEEERRLTERLRAKELPFELREARAATLDDLDLDFFEKQYLPSTVAPEILRENRRSLAHQLAAVRFVTLNSPPQPTVMGILAAGKDPEQFIGGAYVQFLRIDGTGLADPIRDEKRISGPLAQMLRLVDEVLTANISVSVDFKSGATDRKVPEYPLVALQQVVRNAVMHRTYEGTNAPIRILWFSDRIEVVSPGGPFGQVTIENFGKPGITDYRNLYLAEVLYRLGYVQRFGAGIETARDAMHKNGNPPPEFYVSPTHVQVSLRRHP